jgi:hypothetical protein
MQPLVSDCTQRSRALGDTFTVVVQRAGGKARDRDRHPRRHSHCCVCTTLPLLNRHRAATLQLRKMCRCAICQWPTHEKFDEAVFNLARRIDDPQSCGGCRAPLLH